jgi:hypothetical protein
MKQYAVILALVYWMLSLVDLHAQDWPQYLGPNRNSVRNITIWFDSRLLITLDIEPPERIFVSKNKAAEFKAWMVSEN